MGRQDVGGAGICYCFQGWVNVTDWRIHETYFVIQKLRNHLGPLLDDACLKCKCVLQVSCRLLTGRPSP